MTRAYMSRRSDFMQMKRPRVLITGSEGLIGKILRESLRDDFDIYCLDKNSDCDKGVEVDVSSYADLDRAFSRMSPVDCIIHLAGVSRSDADWESVLTTNIAGTRNIYECAKNHNVRKVVFASSGHVTGCYGKAEIITASHPVRPDGDYGSSKAFGEIIARQYFDLYGVNSICLRLGWVLGDNDPSFNEEAMKMWLSHRDLVELMRRSVLSDIHFGVYYGVSNNREKFWRISDAGKEIGYKPKDDSYSLSKHSFSPVLLLEMPWKELGKLKRLIFIIAGAFGKAANLKAWCHLMKPANRRIIKFTGVGNIRSKTLYYPSFYHFLRDIPSVRKPKHHEYLVCQNFLHQDFINSGKPKVFFTRQPPAYMTPETRKNMSREELRPYLYLYSDPVLERRMFYVALNENRRRVLKRMERRLREERPGFCCIINRYVEHDELNLWEQRIRFVRAMGTDIDIYGYDPWQGKNKWKDYDNYRGSAANKMRTLSRYTFALTFENTDSPGYVTEKILHSLCAGTVPLYLGGGCFTDSIPKDCYIDCRSKDPDEIYRLIKDMSHETIVQYRKAAIEFLRSSFADRFTRKYWAEAIIQRLRSQE